LGPVDGDDAGSRSRMSRDADFARLGDLLGEACGLPPDGGAPRGAAPFGGPSRGAARGAPVGAEGRAHSSGSPCPPDDPARLLALAWPEVVGPEVAANARPVQLRRGRLVVSTSSSAWAQTLHLMSDAVASRLNDRLGAGTVEQVVFRHAGWEEQPRGGGRGGRSAAAPPPEPTDREAPLSAEQREALSALEGLGLNPELRENIARAMRAAFVRDQQDSVR